MIIATLIILIGIGLIASSAIVLGISLVMDGEIVKSLFILGAATFIIGLGILLVVILLG